jgi:acylpyruvate hydrolase
MARLATIRTPGGPRAAVMRGDAEAVVLEAYGDVGELLRAGADGAAAVRQALERGAVTAVGERDLLRPVLAPGAVVCVGMNYRAHILEMGRELPTRPTLFSKLPRALTDPFADVAIPRGSEQVDYEGELAVVIGAGGRDIPVERALEHVAGLTILNDVSMRDFQRRTLQWFAGKTWQSSTPVGPWIVTLDELGDLGPRHLTTSVNGEVRQRAPLADLLFDVPTLVADLSAIIELEPGDIIATGTPGGVGEAMQRFLAPGDVVDVRIDGIGAIRTTFTGPAT